MEVTDPVEVIVHDAHARSRAVLRLLMLIVTGVALYLVLPGLIAMFGSLPQLEAVFPAWFVPIFSTGLAYYSRKSITGTSVSPKSPNASVYEIRPAT